MELNFQSIAHFEPSTGPVDELLMFEEVPHHFTTNTEEETPAPVFHTTEHAYADVEFQEAQTILSDGSDHYGVSSIAFDLHEELLWMGNQGGHVTSYYGPGLQKHTSFQVHASDEIRHLLTVESGVLALTRNALRLQLRRGLPIFTHNSPAMSDMQCQMEISNDTILIGGHQPNIVEFNLAQVKETNLVNVGENGCAILRHHPRYICCGDPSGRITLRDPSSLRVCHTLDAHSGSLSDFDVHGNLIVTCGFSNRHGALSVDRILKVYDLRMMRAVSPITVMLDPLLLRFLPSYSSRLAVVSTMGQVQLLDTVALSQPKLCLYQLETQGSLCLDLDVSTSCQWMAFGDGAGSIHTYSINPLHSMFNTYSRETEFADPVETLGSWRIDDETTPFSSIPLQFYPDSYPLLSDWPSKILKKVYRKSQPIDPEILRTMKMQGTIGYALNPLKGRRNQVPYKLDFKGRAQSKHFPNDSRGGTPNKIGRGGSAGGISSDGSNSGPHGSSSGGGDDAPFIAIPRRYRKIEVKYSRLGMDDFDFDQYNKTGFCGLEATLPNSYCNAMIQVLYYINPIRQGLLTHLCQKEFCLACELGFLFHMLDISQGLPCQSSNFLRAFRTVPEASALGLILSDVHQANSKTKLNVLIQSWNRFILHQIHTEILEEKKRFHNESRASSSSPQPGFVYKEKDFPSIGSRTSTTKEDTTAPFTSTTTTTTTYTTTSSLSTPGEWNARAKMVSGQIQDDANTKSPEAGEGKNKTPLESPEEDQSEETDVTQLFGTKQIHCHKCSKCGNEVHKESILLLCNLIYPLLGINGNNAHSFGDVLKQSLSPKQITPAWCDNCDRYQPTLQSRKIAQLPKILAINCGLNNPQDKHFWQTQANLVVQAASGETIQMANLVPPPSTLTPPHSSKMCRYGETCTRIGCRFRHRGTDSTTETNPTPSPSPAGASSVSATPPNKSNSHLYFTHSWLPMHIRIQLNNEGEIAVNKANSSDTYDKTDPNNVLYDLCAVVCHIADPQQSEKGNLVALVNVAPEFHQRSMGSPVSQWYIFNDFSITPIPAQEVVWFNLEWKVPCVLYWIARDISPLCSGTTSPIPEIVNPVTADVFCEDKCLARSNGGSRSRLITFTPLSADETPQRGDIVAMDAEFVTLNQEEAELRSDGKLSTIKPSHMSVARITCIRGPGSYEGTPFIDDYISTQEQVVDYLTKFSGIKPGDLDANFSSKHLTTLKATYQKLRYLVDNGVIFVGHGLKNDFRVINLVVPAGQVIDTVLLFHLPHHRMVSLKFLAWHFLGLKIQSVTHDSIEDARTALQLYLHHMKLKSEGILRKSLNELYETGKRLQWKVPGIDD